MWIANNNTSFAAERTFLTDKDGRDLWAVAVKATFLVKPDGSTEPAAEQVPVCLEPQHRGDPEKTGLLHETDFIHPKRNTDVLLEGHAWAPGGQPASQVDVMMLVGKIKKVARVTGDRAWKPGMIGLKMSDPIPFKKMPLVWERSFGGTDRVSENPKLHDWEPYNPVGAGFAVQAEHAEGLSLPNVEDPARLISGWKDRPKPMGFGPVARVWMPRRQHAGTYDEKWEKDRQPLLPVDFDDRFNQTAPLDQQAAGFLRGGETVELFNLTPSGYLKFALPRVALRFETRVASEDVDHRAELYTVILEPDIPRVILLFLAVLPVQGRKLKLRSTTIIQKEYVEL